MAELVLKINDDLAKVAFKIFEDYGLSPIEAFNLFLEKAAELKALPFDCEERYFEPNEETIQAIIEGREEFNSGKLKIYKTSEEMMKDIFAIVENKK